MEIYIITKNVYGNDLFYIKGKVAAKVVRRLTGRKTVTRQDIDDLSLLGLKIRVSEEAQEALGWTAEEAGAKAVDDADMEAWRVGRQYTPATEADIAVWKRAKLAGFAETAKKATAARWEAYNKTGKNVFGEE